MSSEKHEYVHTYRSQWLVLPKGLDDAEDSYDAPVGPHTFGRTEDHSDLGDEWELVLPVAHSVTAIGERVLFSFCWTWRRPFEETRQEQIIREQALLIAYHKANAHRCLTEHLSELSARAGDFSRYAERDEARRALQAAEDALKTAGLDP